jgi:hypothetical protein
MICSIFFSFDILNDATRCHGNMVIACAAGVEDQGSNPAKVTNKGQYNKTSLLCSNQLHSQRYQCDYY